MTAVALLLMGGAGYGLLRVVLGGSPRRLVGPLAAAGVAALFGAVVIGLSTTYAGVAGLPTRPWPVIGTVVAVLLVAGLLPAPVARRLRVDRGTPAPTGDQAASRLGDVLVALAVPVIGVWTLWGMDHAPVRFIDEFAIWAVRGRSLSITGHLDDRVFAGFAAHYQHLDYPLLVPSLIAWGDGIAGHSDDTTGHVLLGALTLGMVAVLGWAANRLAPAAGPLVRAALALAAPLLVAGTPGLLARWGTYLTADAPVVALSVSLAAVLALWVQHGDGRWLPVAGVLGAGAASTKVEGLLFTLALFVAAGACRAREPAARRAWLFTAAALVASQLPWQLWAKLHHIQSDLLNGRTLSVAHLRSVAGLSGLTVRQMVAYWPGHGWGLVAAAVLAAALAVASGGGRLVVFLVSAWALATVGIWAQYVISAGQGSSGAAAATALRGHFASSAPRALLVPAVLLTLMLPVFAGLALGRDQRAADGPADQPANSASTAADSSGQARTAH